MEDNVAAEGGTQQLGDSLVKENLINVEFGQALPQCNLEQISVALKSQLLHFNLVGVIGSQCELLRRLGFILNLHSDFEQHVGQATKLIKSLQLGHLSAKSLYI